MLFINGEVRNGRPHTCRRDMKGRRDKLLVWCLVACNVDWPRRQTHFGNNLLKSGLKQVSGSPSIRQRAGAQNSWFLFEVTYQNEKLGIASAALGYPPSEGPRRSESHPPAQRLPGNCLQCANVSFPTQTNNRTFKSKYQTKVHKHST